MKQSIFYVSRSDLPNWHIPDGDKVLAFIVVAESEEAARSTYPDPSLYLVKWCHSKHGWIYAPTDEELSENHSWVNSLSDVKVEEIGIAYGETLSILMIQR